MLGTYRKGTGALALAVCLLLLLTIPVSGNPSVPLSLSLIHDGQEPTTVSANEALVLTFEETLVEGKAFADIKVQAAVALNIAVSLQGQRLYVAPQDDWPEETALTLTIPAQAVTSIDGERTNDVLTLAFGVSPAGEWTSFVTEPGVSFEVYAPNTPILLKAAHLLDIGEGFAGITLHQLEGEHITPIETTLEGKTLRILPLEPLQPGERYRLVVPEQAIVSFTAGGNVEQRFELELHDEQPLWRMEAANTQEDSGRTEEELSEEEMLEEEMLLRGMLMQLQGTAELAPYLYDRTNRLNEVTLTRNGQVYKKVYVYDGNGNLLHTAIMDMTE